MTGRRAGWIGDTVGILCKVKNEIYWKVLVSLWNWEKSSTVQSQKGQKPGQLWGNGDQKLLDNLFRSITLPSSSIPMKNLVPGKDSMTGWAERGGWGEEHCDWHQQCYSSPPSPQNYLADSRKGGVGFSGVKITNALMKEERHCLWSKGKRRKCQQTEETNDKASVEGKQLQALQLPPGAMQCECSLLM